MMKNALTNTCLYIIVLLLGTACVNTKKSVYFSTQYDSTIFANTQIPQSPIQNGDLLSISVNGLNNATTEIFNRPNQTATTVTAASGAALQASGYLVSAEGNIQFPVVGNVRVTGLTTLQLKDQLTRTLTERKLVVDPVVTVRQLNFRVSVLGEVGRPGLLYIPNEQITLLEALGLAGDITIYGRKDNVLIIRQEADRKVAKRINMNSNEIFTSPYYYLKSNDVIYVEPNKARVAGSSRTTQLLPIVLSGLSFIGIIVGYIINK